MYATLDTATLLAETIAANLQPLVLALLTGALALTGFIFLSWRWLRDAPDAPLERVATTGFVLALLASLAFSAIATSLGEHSPLQVFDHALSDALRATQSADTLQLFARLTRFGDTATLTALGAVGTLWLLWRRQRLLAATWATAIGGNSLLNVGLKSLFERVRPLHDHGFASETSWSFPSGHSSGTVVAYGILAYVALRVLPRAWHLPVLLLAVSIALLTAFSRVVLQVHFASDALAGMCSGAAWLTLCITASEALRQRPPGLAAHPGPQRPL